MHYVRKCAVGSYVAIAMRVYAVEAKVSAIGEPFLVLTGVDMDGSDVGPLRHWQRNEGEVSAGCSYAVRGLKAAHDRAWGTTRQ